MVPQDQPNKAFELISRFIGADGLAHMMSTNSPTPQPFFAHLESGHATEEEVAGGSSSAQGQRAGLIVLSIVAALGVFFSGYLFYTNLVRTTRERENKRRIGESSSPPNGNLTDPRIGNPILVQSGMDRIPTASPALLPHSPPRITPSGTADDL